MNQNEGAPGQADVAALPVSGSTTHDKPQEPMKGSELTVVQRSAIDIGELEREMKAAGKLTARGREMISLICGRQTSVRGCGGSKLRQQQRAA